ncbi:MAG: calcium/sodium antiporter [Prevotella sp.]|nr:calcium/sodium antiporter [Prevotella sp.]
MITSILSIFGGIAIVLWGANQLTEGSVAIAERMRIPQIVIGLTIVAMGTSMPEFCVSLMSALKGTPDLAVGNVVGSNIFNALLIVGLAAVVSPMTILKTTVKKDIPFALVAAVILMMMCFDGTIGRIDAAVLFVAFVMFMYMTVKGAQVEQSEMHEETQMVCEALSEKPKMGYIKATIWVVVGLVCLIGGSTLFVNGATDVAAALGISEAVIGLTVVAGGTSLPELATSIVSARKGNSGIAIGNVLGSNVFNILFILGATGLVKPMQLEGITLNDLSVMVISMIMIWFFSFTKYTIQRWEGAILAVSFIAYTAFLIANL